MIPATVDQLLTTQSAEALERLFNDRQAVFLVDWREADESIVEYCEEILKTGDLSADLVNIDADPGFELYILYRGRRVKVPLVIGPEDRHITIYTLNQMLALDYEIRVCVDSNGWDTLTFLPLATADWGALEIRFGEAVEKRFRKVERRPNLFTESG